MKKELVSLFLICSVFLISFIMAIEIPEGLEFPEGIDPEMMDQIPDAYMDPILYGEDFELTDEILNQLMDSYCILIEPFKAQVVGTEIPKQVPFKTDIFSVYIAEEPIASLSIEDKLIKDITCGNVSEDTTYNIYISSVDIFYELGEESDYIEFYKAKKKSGEIKIKAVGFGRSIKLFFLNIGVGVAGWFI